MQCFKGIIVYLHLLLMVDKLLVDSLQYFGRDFGKLHGSGGTRLPGLGVAPVDVGTVAALVGTTVAAAY